MRQTTLGIAVTSVLTLTIAGPVWAKGTSPVPERLAKSVSPDVAPGVVSPSAFVEQAGYRMKGALPEGQQGDRRDGADKAPDALADDAEPVTPGETEPGIAGHISGESDAVAPEAQIQPEAPGDQVAMTRAPHPELETESETETEGEPGTDGEPRAEPQPIVFPEAAEDLYLFGLALADGTAGPANLEAAAIAFSRAAQAGHPGAAFELAWALETGRGVDPAPDAAVAWYQRAIDAGDARAMNNLGWLFAQGKGVRRDEARALALYRQAAQAGEPSAMGNLGWMMENGIGTAQDLAGAAGWYDRAAEQGDAQAMLSLGNLHLVGDGVDHDPRKALTWFARARAKGRVEALSYMGEVFEKTAALRDPERAAGLYIRALEAGDPWPLSRASRSWDGATARAMQLLLADRGFYQGEIDGAIGPGSRGAMRALIAEVAAND